MELWLVQLMENEMVQLLEFQKAGLMGNYLAQ